MGIAADIMTMVLEGTHELGSGGTARDLEASNRWFPSIVDNICDSEDTYESYSPEQREDTRRRIKLNPVCYTRIRVSFSSEDKRVSALV